MQNTPAYSPNVVSDRLTTETGVAWPAIFGGALAAIGLSLVLSPLGAGFGFGTAWHHEGDAEKAITAASAIWLIVAQWISSGLGGYLTGRLRKKWAGAHVHEVFFRDTVHGFLSWALASAVGAIALASLAAHMTEGTRHADMPGTVPAYYSDSLFRTERASAEVSPEDRAESSRILAAGAVQGELPSSDKNYLARLVAARTGLSPADADKRVDDVLARQKAVMETAHKNVAKASLFLSIALLIGAFIASAAGALGGRDRDFHFETGRFGE